MASNRQISLLLKAHDLYGPIASVEGNGLGVRIVPRAGLGPRDGWHPSTFGYDVSDAQALLAEGLLERTVECHEQKVSYRLTVLGLKAIGKWPEGADEAILRSLGCQVRKLDS